MSATQFPVRIELPADPGFLRIARLNATAYGARLDLDVEQLDDLRLAVNEALTWTLDDPDGPPTITLTIHQEGNQIVLTGGGGTSIAHDTPNAFASTAPESSAIDDLIGAILGATVDDFWLDSGSPRRFQLRKSA